MNKNSSIPESVENYLEQCDECLYWPLLFDEEINCPTACECKAEWEVAANWVARAKQIGFDYLEDYTNG